MFHTAALLLSCVVQCTDPPAPPGGFSYYEVFDQEVNFSDGETTTVVARWPRDEPGTCGWPVIVFVHGLFGSKSSVGPLGRQFADAGYFTLTFDVRGHATASGNHTLWGLRERLDVVEILNWAQATYPGLIDGDRIGLGGTSQGAILSFGAAAWGGRPIEPNPWLAGVYPDIDVVVVENLTADFLSTFAPQSLGVHTNVAAALVATTEVRFDPGLVSDALHALLDEDYFGWASIVGDASRNPRPLVPTMTTPVLAMTAWDDFWFPAGPLVDAVGALPPGVPRKVYLGCGGHSTPANVAERQLRNQWRREWFDRFLKGVPTTLEQTPRVLYAVTPSDVGSYLDESTLWERQESSDWPPQGSRNYRMYLREGGHLWPFEPFVSEAEDVLSQQTGGNFTMNDAVAAQFRLPQIEAEIERHALVYDSYPLPSPLRFAGDPMAHLRVTPSSSRWQISAVLWDIAPDGSEHYVCSGSHFSHDQDPIGVEQEITIRMGSNAYEFPAGHQIRVRFENMHVHEPPVGALLRYAPTMTSFDVSLRHERGAESWIELPISESAPIGYGWSQVASNGCVASVATSGVASPSSTAPFEIRATDVVSGRDGLMIYGFGARKVFLGGGYLWVLGPIRRGEIMNSGGTGANDCSGSFTYDFNARILSGADTALVPGARVNAQFWFRDPAAASTTNLTSAVEFSILP